MGATSVDVLAFHSWVLDVTVLILHAKSQLVLQLGALPMVLDLSENHLAGSLPSSWGNFAQASHASN